MSAFHPLRVAAVDRLTADAVAVTFDVPPELAPQYAYTPGQHLTIRTVIGGEELRRSYSICSPPSQGRLRVAVKRLPGGVFSAHAAERLHVGDVLDIMRPAGRFGVAPDPANARHYAAVVAGSGITPVLSILAAVLETEPGSRCTLVYGNRDANSIMFLEELADLKDRWPDRLHVVHVLTREAQDAAVLNGRIDAAKLGALLDGPLAGAADGVDAWFLCGPFAMVEQVRATLLARGVPPRRVRTELFHVEDEPAPSRSRAGAPDGAAAAEPAGAAAVDLTVRLDGRSTRLAAARDRSVLDAVLAARPDAPFACKGGVCGTCRARLVDGEVTMGRVYALEPEEVEAGFVLACRSHPASDRLSVDFDA